MTRLLSFGTGGIGGPEDLFNYIFHGADAGQALTLWPPEGPDFPKRCAKGLVSLLRKHGFKHVKDAVGAAA